MIRNAYVDLCLSMQAIRRNFEGLRTPLASAAGVKASIYTHQLSNVLRILSDVRVRHLLADEVGLGKTVQALMVLNALHYQRPSLRALVIVPDRLVPQWRDEIMTRAHTAPFGEDRGKDEEEKESGQYIRLAWEAQLRLKNDRGDPKFSLSDIDPSQFDVIVVDELHRLRSDLQDRIVRSAQEFEHVLILTATPSFQNIARHAQLFALLEPERTALLRWRIAAKERGLLEGLSWGDNLSKWPEWATENIVKEFLESDSSSAAVGDKENLSEIAMAHCAYRRVIRTRRADYSGVLPRRQHHSIIVEPLGAESDRQSLMWQYFEHLGELSIEVNPIRLAKRVILSPPSLEQRVDFFRRKGQDRNNILERVKPLVHQSQGDSRVDALVDLLAQIWSHDISERVLVAAQDNLTVDYLYELVQARIPLIGPLDNRVPLVAACVRQGMMTEAVEDLGGFGNETNENLEAFQRGEAQVLFAPEAAHVGLNLQCARVLVLYSVPWEPQEVEQWVGRLDRIGNVAAFSNEDGSKTIDVYTIAQRGLVDEKVVTVLKRFQVFEHSVNLDGDHLEEVANRIEDAALRPDLVNWHELETDAEEMAVEDEIQELESALRSHIPWTVLWATKERERLDTLPPAQPTLIKLPEHTSTGPRAWDRAFEGMVKLLKRAGDYHIRVNTDPDTGSRFQSLWYQFGDREMGRQRPVLSRVIYSFGADPGHERNPRYAHAFITRRGDIEAQPRRSVKMPLGVDSVRRPLRFLSFGEPLHDELIQGWLPKEDEPFKFNVSYFNDHDIWEHTAPALYLIRVSIIDPSGVLTEPEVEERVLESISRVAINTKPERLPEIIIKIKEKMTCALEADVRWLRAQLIAKMKLESLKIQNEQWTPVDAEEVAALLNPMAHGRKGVPRAGDLCVSKNILRAAEAKLNNLRSADESTAKSAWSNLLPEFKDALQARLLVVQEEGRDAVALARCNVKDAEDALAAALDRGNRPQIARAENIRDESEDSLRMLEVFWRERESWLRGCEQGVLDTLPEEQLICLLNAQKAE